MFWLYYSYYSFYYWYYCETYVVALVSYVKILWSFLKPLLTFRRRVLRFFSFLSLGGFFVLVWFCDVVVHQPALEALAVFLHLPAISLLTMLLLGLIVFSLVLPPRWRLSFLVFLGSFCFVVLQNFVLGRGVYYNNLLLNLAVTAVDAVVEEPTGVMHNIHVWICAHPYLTAGIAFAVGVSITVGIYALTSYYNGYVDGSFEELRKHEEFNINCRTRRPLTPENYEAHKDYLTYLPDGTVRPSTYEEVIRGFGYNCRVARIPDTPIFRNDGLKTWENFKEDLKEYPLNTKMDLRILVNQFRKSMDQIERETYIMHWVLYALFDGGSNEAMVREFSYWDAKYTPLEHLAIVKTQANETAIVFRGWLESFTYDDWKFNKHS